MITTARGDVAVEEIQVGEKVWTRGGLCPVVASGMTAENAPLWEVTFSNGVKIVGTATHPVWVDGKGFVRLFELCYDDAVVTLQENKAWRQSNQLSGKVWSTAVTQSRAALATETITDAVALTTSAGEASCIGTFGLRRTAQSLKAFISIILMGIRAITPFRILNASLCPSIMLGTHPLTRSDLKGCVSILTRFDTSQGIGILQKRASNGIASTQNASGKKNNLLNNSVDTVTKHFKQSLSSPMAGSARTPVKPRGEGRAALTMFKERVKSAVNRFLSTNTRKPSTVRIFVQDVRATGETANVFNITVEGHREYYAHGVLLHNCDDWRYALMSRPKPSGDAPPQPEPPLTGWRAKLAREHHLLTETRSRV